MRKEQIITTNNNQMEEKGMKSRFIHFKKITASNKPLITLCPPGA